MRSRDRRFEPPRIVLFSKLNCSLCEDARAALDAIGEPYEVAEDAARASRLPIVEVDGIVVAELRVEEPALRRAIRRARRAKRL